MSFALLACPNCASTFRVPADAVGEQGRVVRCSACTHQWRAWRTELSWPEGESDPLAQHASSYDPDDEDFGTPPPKADFAPPQAEHTPDEHESDDALEALLARAEVATAPPGEASLEAMRRKTRRRLLVTAHAACALIAGALALLAFRDPVLHTLPQAEALYGAVGYHDTRELQLADIVFSRQRSGDNWRYGLKGKIVHHGEETLPTPALRARLFGKDGEMLEEWLMERDEPLLAGEHKSFNARGLTSAAQGANMMTLEIGSPLELSLRR